MIVDAMIMIHMSKRPVSFMVAKKTYDSRTYGFFCKLIGCIPVLRGIDLKKKCIGHINYIKNNIIYGKDTKFT